jgi:heavy metal sensor kinase
VRSRSLRFRLSWINGVVVAAAFLSVAFVRYFMISYRAYVRFDEQLLRDAGFLSSRLTVTPEYCSLRTEGLSSEGKISLREIQYGTVVADSSGKVMHPDQCSAQIQQLLSHGLLNPVLRSKGGITAIDVPEGNSFRFMSLPAETGPGYFVHVGANSQSVVSVLQEYRAMYLYSVPLMMVLSITVAWYLSGMALKPFSEVAKAVQQYSSKNLHSPIETRYTEKEVQTLVDAFNQMAERLHASFLQMSRFNADVAHELRTPLAVLQGETEIALQTPGLREEIKAVLCSNLEELERLSRIVKDMLTLAEADAGTQVIAQKEVRLGPLALDLVEQMRILASDRNIEIAAENIDDAVVLGDELWIRRALLNLIDNAIKYSRNGGKVELWVQAAANSARIGVRDEGIGIASKDLPRIFDRLYRSDPARSRSTGGSGLGLAFVKWIVEAHHGHILVESQPDRGTLFMIEFPLACT